MHEYCSDNVSSGVGSKPSRFRIEKRKQQAPSGRGASKAEAAPGRVDRVGVGEHDEQAPGREVHVIAFSRENGSKAHV